MNLLFLDVDGVLNNNVSWESKKRVECGVVSVFGSWYEGGKYDELFEGRVRAVSIVELK